jgi:hypothetical protein
MNRKLIKELISTGYFVATIDGRECTTLSLFIKNVANAFKFPDYFGNNVNAFFECINDLDWLDASNYVLIIQNSNYLLFEDPNNKSYVQDMLKRIIAEWSNVPNYVGEDKYRKPADFKICYE